MFTHIGSICNEHTDIMILLRVGRGWVRRMSVSECYIVVVMCMNMCSLKWKIKKEIIYIYKKDVLSP